MKKRDALAFLDHARGECAAAGVSLRLEARPEARGGFVGSFCDERRVLHVCVERADWLGVLAHELSHLRQFIERPAFFRGAIAEVNTFESWVLGKLPRLKARRLRTITRAIQRLELDAERRALKMIRTFNLLDDVSGYVRKANFYVWQHEIARRVGKWPRYGIALGGVIGLLPERLMRVEEVGRAPEVMEQNLI